jgi:hypothetical protein
MAGTQVWHNTRRRGCPWILQRRLSSSPYTTKEIAMKRWSFLFAAGILIAVPKLAATNEPKTSSGPTTAKETLSFTDASEDTINRERGQIIKRTRERIRRQRELAERAWQTFRNIETLGPDTPAESNKFWEELGQIEGELQWASQTWLSPVEQSQLDEEATRRQLRAEIQRLRREIEDVRVDLKKSERKQKGR